MADNKILNFGADVLPNETEKYYLGNSDKKWIIDASQLTGTLSSDIMPDVIIYADDFESLPETGEDGKLYITADNGKMYKWDGDDYTEIGGNSGKQVELSSFEPQNEECLIWIEA